MNQNFWTKPGVTRRVKDARGSGTAWSEVVGLTYQPVMQRMTKWLSKNGLLSLAIEVDDLFDRVWTSKMQAAIKNVDFRDRTHFFQIICKKMRLEASTLAGPARRGLKSSSAAIEEEVSPEMPPGAIVEYAEFLERLDRAITKLPPDLRVPIEAHFFEGKSLRAIGAEAGLSSSGVKDRLDRAHRLLKTELGSA